MILLLALACAPKHPAELRPGPADVQEVLRRAGRARFDHAVLAPFDIRLATPNERVSAQGTLLVDPEGRFRLELRGPIGGPALVITSDGVGMWAWQPGKNVFFEADGAGVSVVAATGGEVGLPALAVALAGHLPDLGEPDALALDVDGWPTYTWAGPEGARVIARLDPASAGLRDLDVVDRDGRVWLEATWTPGKLHPEDLHVTLPVQAAEAQLDFGDWVKASPDASVYRLQSPPGAEVRPIRLTRELPPVSDTGAPTPEPLPTPSGPPPSP